MPDAANPRRQTRLEVRLNGTATPAREGETILEVARRAGVAIPTLCHAEGLSVHGGCRLCVVEVAEQHRLLPACATGVVDHMEVVTDSPALREHRRTIVELLFAEGNHVCSVCVANGGCELQDLAEYLRVDHLAMPGRYPLVEVDATHPRFVHDPNKCVLCTRCVRTCAEVEGAFVWAVASRGSASFLVTDLHRPWGEATSCTDCGKCVDACPTGALHPKDAGVGQARHDVDVLAYLADARAGEWRERGGAHGATP